MPLQPLLQGTDSSRVEAVLRAVPEGRAPSVSGLEVSKAVSAGIDQLPPVLPVLQVK
jgi:uncharacterized ParB-like nuclease family protein